MKNSEKIKKILIDMAIDCTLPSDMNELDETIFSFCDEDEDTWNGYSIEDIKSHCEDDLTDDEAKEVLDIIKRKCDCNQSFLDNIEHALDIFNKD